MFYLFLKFILAVFLTAIPFLFHYLVKPKSMTSSKWKNSIALGENLYPSFIKKKRRLTAWLLRVYHKMKFSRNARMFFIFSFVIVLLAVQVVDFNVSNFIYAHIVKISTLHTASETSMSSLGALFNTHFISLQATPFLVCLFSFFVSTLFIYYSFSNFILTEIHNRKWLKFLLSVAIVSLTIFSLGKLFLISELLYLTLLAGIAYPNFDFDEYTKWRKRIYHSKTKSGAQPMNLAHAKLSA